MEDSKMVKDIKRKGITPDQLEKIKAQLRADPDCDFIESGDNKGGDVLLLDSKKPGKVSKAMKYDVLKD